MVHKRISIIGLGLIGGSLAKALRSRAGITDIAAVDSDADTINHAINDGTITYGTARIDDYILNSDIIFICTPVRHTIDYIKLMAPRLKPGCIITDVGSTKTEIIEHIKNMPNPPCFIGGHPMAGSEKAGYSASRLHLFENAYYILSPSKSTTEESMKCMGEIVEGIGGIPVLLEAEEHDKITGGISHVPHIIASALVNMIMQMDSSDGKMQMLAAGGFKDITRIASSNPQIWESITLSNKLQIKRILNYYIDMLGKFDKYIDNNDSKNIYSFFESAKLFRDSIPAGKVGFIAPIHEIIVDVVDEPGIIGEIATLLGSSGINIKNISVTNSREFEQGCLRITLPDYSSMDKAYDLLTDKGYKAYRVN